MDVVKIIYKVSTYIRLQKVPNYLIEIILKLVGNSWKLARSSCKKRTTSHPQTDQRRNNHRWYSKFPNDLKPLKVNVINVYSPVILIFCIVASTLGEEAKYPTFSSIILGIPLKRYIEMFWHVTISYLSISFSKIWSIILVVSMQTLGFSSQKSFHEDLTLTSFLCCKIQWIPLLRMVLLPHLEAALRVLVMSSECRVSAKKRSQSKKSFLALYWWAMSIRFSSISSMAIQS